eukprot:Protomagalhaensia_wolfi_Nauph_80__440@NODE_1244_length_1637_cov_18_545682_g957_i0_p1_GENE_NODE_1244_length_1637_cov_18_545682_g957_i0NODE_1244_length_1637_cov_18_545682_g957_i0_p1_ORF_typecomplete_len533_score91_40IFRD/PF05004_13/14IFRD/PF05004_13/11_NODE_1244_length_1637_cov_18_545682_g957_i01791600
MGDLVDKLVDAPTKKQSSVLTRFYNALATQNFVRVVMTDQVSWGMESTLDCLVQILGRTRGARSSSALADGIRATKAICLILVCFYKSQIKDKVSGTCLESIASTCLSITPRVTPGLNEKRLVSSGYLVWLCFILLALLIKYELVSHTMPEDSLALGNGTAVPEWPDWYRLQCERFLKKKENQLKQLNLGAVNDEPRSLLGWTQEDTITLDGICISMAIYLTGLPQSILFNRNTRFSHGFIWNFLERLATILMDSPVDFVNTYIASLPAEVTKSKSGNIFLGLPHLLGIVYEAWWEGSVTLNPQDIEICAYDEQLIKILELFSGKSAVEQKSLTKNLTKEVQKIFRDVCTTVDGGAYLQPITVNVRKNDVTCVQASFAASNPLVDRLNGEVMEIGAWDDLLDLKICREFAGNHSILAFAMWMEETGRSDVIKGFANEERSEKAHRHASNRKHQKLERQNLAAIKRARNTAWED